MSGTRYPLNLAEMCWRLELRKPELIEKMHREHQEQRETIERLTEQLRVLRGGVTGESLEPEPEHPNEPTLIPDTSFA
jgi:hypothetical protein